MNALFHIKSKYLLELFSLVVSPIIHLTNSKGLVNYNVVLGGVLELSDLELIMFKIISLEKVNILAIDF